VRRIHKQNMFAWTICEALEGMRCVGIAVRTMIWFVVSALALCVAFLPYLLHILLCFRDGVGAVGHACVYLLFHCI
jgi:hypothetical protein